ncbi:F-box domain [Cryptosporidium sp. chipmunk genotype I]|uniref:F-box domain n=1 Tax=Cryptosporidium sp. chipmunk genotype I TaxID=1280935 RepID=UPI00351A8464|nr:F-box domain [Cryptosporidium sp. chipmunk genotype I]
MLNKSEWSFFASNVEVRISGKRITKNLGGNGAGIYYKLCGNDIEVCIHGLNRGFNYSIKRDVLSIFWKFYLDGKFTIVIKKNIIFFFSNAISNSIYCFVENVSSISPQSLSPNFNPNNYLICKSSLISEKKFLDCNAEIPTNKKQKTAKLEQINHQKIRKYVPESGFENEKRKISCRNNLNSRPIISGNCISNLPEDLIFYVLSMLVTPITHELNEKPCVNYNSFYKDDLIKSTYLPFVNSRLFKFFQTNVWEISINHRLHKKSNIINFKNLGSLIVSNKYIKDSDIKEFASSKHLPRSINKLTINGNNNITDSTLSLFLLRLKNLESLEIIDCNNITGNSLFRLIGMKSSIKFLKLGSRIKQNFSINDDSLKDLFDLNCQGKSIETGINNSTKPSIVHLELQNCVGITKIPPNIKECCYNIEYLDLRGCKNIFNIEFESLFRYLNNLKVLVLSNTNISDQVLNIIFENCSGIEILDISYCANISEGIFDKIPSKLKLISGLKLSYCLNFKANALIQILTGCKFLEMIDLTGCFNIECNLINYRNMTFTSKLRKIGVFRLSLDSKRLNDWILSNIEKGSNHKETNSEICYDRELLISEFTFKYEKKRDKYLGRSKPIWIN